LRTLDQRILGCGRRNRQRNQRRYQGELRHGNASLANRDHKPRVGSMAIGAHAQLLRATPFHVCACVDMLGVHRAKNSKSAM
jgi:hypothetical protein